MDNLNPNHYKKGKVECIDAIESVISNVPSQDAYFVGNILKYIWRYEHKNGVEDLRKAKWYLDRLIKNKAGD